MLIFVLNDLHELRDDEHEGRLTVEEGTRHAGPPADLTVDTLDGVVGADAVPVLAGKTVYAKVSEKSPRATPATSTKRIPLSSLTTASVLNSAAARARAAPQAYVIDAGICHRRRHRDRHAGRATPPFLDQGERLIVRRYDGFGHGRPQYASCLDNLNHTEAVRAPSIGTLFSYQSAQMIVRYQFVN